MASVCRDCGHPFEPGQRFCRGCGREFGADIDAPSSFAVTPPPPPPVKRRPRITLLELMIVVAILGIFAAVAVPSRPRWSRPPKKKVCVSNMKTIAGAVELYLMEHTGGSPHLRALVDGGYLKRMPECLSNGNYSIRVRAGKGAPEIDVSCSVHGGVDDTTSGI